METTSLPPSPSSTLNSVSSTSSYAPKATTPSRRPYRPQTSSTHNPTGTPQVEINGESDSDEDVTYVVPGTVREEFPPRRTLRPILIPKKPTTTPVTISTATSISSSVSSHSSSSTSTSIVTRPRPQTPVETTTRNTQNIILDAHPQDNEIPDSVNIRQNQAPNVNVPYSVNNSDRKETREAKLNLGAIVALGAFGGFVFLAAVITSIIILVRSTENSKRRRKLKEYLKNAQNHHYHTRPSHLIDLTRPNVKPTMRARTSCTNPLCLQYERQSNASASISSRNARAAPTTPWGSSVLALPFDDQKLGQRDISTFGRRNTARADEFTEEKKDYQKY